MLQLSPGGFLKAVVDDTSPVLGGHLDGGGFNISNVGTLTVTTLNFTTLNVSGSSDLNSSGGNNDTRIRGDGDAALIFADASADKGGIGTNAPWQKLHVMGLMVQERSGKRWHFGPSADGIRFALSETGVTDYFQIDSADTPTSFGIINCNVGINTASPSTRLDINSDRLRVRSSLTPASAGAGGLQGYISWDSGFIYVCVAANTWKRASLATW